MEEAQRGPAKAVETTKAVEKMTKGQTDPEARSG
jgi:hypothetical protein